GEGRGGVSAGADGTAAGPGRDRRGPAPALSAAASQTFTTPSSPAEARCFPSRLKATQVTSDFPCAGRTTTPWPVLAAHRRTHPSAQALARVLPSGENATDRAQLLGTSSFQTRLPDCPSRT